MRHDIVSENKNEDVEADISQHWDSETKKRWHPDSRTKNRNIFIQGLKHHDIEKRTQLSHDIVIPGHFFQREKITASRFRDWETTILRFQDQKATTSTFSGVLTLMSPDMVGIPFFFPSTADIQINRPQPRTVTDTKF